jgi:hypothetical protein
MQNKPAILTRTQYMQVYNIYHILQKAKWRESGTVEANNHVKDGCPSKIPPPKARDATGGKKKTKKIADGGLQPGPLLASGIFLEMAVTFFLWVDVLKRGAKM